jgi:hypothetical protein
MVLTAMDYLRSTDAQPPINLLTPHTFLFFLPTLPFGYGVGEASEILFSFFAIYTKIFLKKCSDIRDFAQIFRQKYRGFIPGANLIFILYLEGVVSALGNVECLGILLPIRFLPG